jgi:hypothetical protein
MNKKELKLFTHNAIRKHTFKRLHKIVILRYIHEFKASWEIIELDTDTGKFTLKPYHTKETALNHYKDQIKKLKLCSK